MTRCDFISDGLRKGTRRPPAVCRRASEKVIYESQGKFMGWDEFSIRFPSIKIILPRQRGWLSSAMSAIKALYPPLIRVKEKEEGEKTPGCFSAGVLLHGLPFASFRNDMKYRTNNKKGKTWSSCHRGISTGGMVTTYTAPSFFGISWEKTSQRTWLNTFAHKSSSAFNSLNSELSIALALEFFRMIKLRSLKSDYKCQIIILLAILGIIFIDKLI